MLSVWAIDVAQLREMFLELSALGEPSGEGIVPTAVPDVLFSALERGDDTTILVEVPKAAREIAEIIDSEIDEVCEVLAGVEFEELYPDEVPLLASADGEFWAVAAPSSPEVLWADIEDVLAEQSAV